MQTSRVRRLPPSLDDQQLQILQHLACGCSPFDVAQLLDVRPRAVVLHKYRIMELLEVHSDAELVACVRARGLLEGSEARASVEVRS